MEPCVHVETMYYKGPVGLSCCSEGAWAAGWKGHWGLEHLGQASPQEPFGWRVWGEASFYLTPFMALLAFPLGTLGSRSGGWWHPRAVAGSRPFEELGAE